METKILQVNPEQFGDEELQEACQVLRNDGLVAFPTETVYGLGGNALHKEAANHIYAAKGRPSDNPLIVHISAYTEPFSPIWILISLGIGLVLAFLCTMGMRAQLKSVRTQDSAVDYVRQGSMELTRSNDIFLYHTVTKTAKPKDSDSSSGGSDSDHGGTGGSF